jgi:hypothetical protein
MRKLALLLAAALMVSAPLVATMTTDSYAAAKKAKKAAKAAPAPKDTGPQAPFQSMHNALSDLGGQLATYRYDPNAPASKGKKK